MILKLILIILFISSNVLAESGRIIIGSTTSTHDTGLLDYLNKKFFDKHNVKTHVLSMGTGQAIEIAPLRSSTSDILNLASVAAYSAGVISYKKKN